MGMEKIDAGHQSAIESQPAIGRIVSVTGSQAVIMLDLDAVMSPVHLENRPDMGTLIKIDAKHTTTLGLISALSAPAPVTSEEEKEIWIAEVELVGELVKDANDHAISFRRGVSSYPRLGDIAFLAIGHDLEMAYSWSGSKTLKVGAISQAPEIPAMVRTDDLLGKHFAILGTTGAGKSYTTALILRRILQQNPKAHILLLDPHNEYANSFKEMAEIITPSDLQLPYWFLTFEEIIEVLINEPEKNEAQIEILADLIPLAKHRYIADNNKVAASTDLLRVRAQKNSHITVDTPTPYRLADIIDIIKEKMGSLEHKKTLGPYKALKMKLESISQDSRYTFMFGSMAVQDHMGEILGRLFRIPVNDKPIAILQMTGLPLEIVNVVVSVLARLSFDIAQLSGGKVSITLVCEEAHRYIPNDKVSGFGPTRRSIAKIAKEGRKYGVSIAIITQRPSELDATILSMCNTVFAMRMANEKDQNIVSAAISDAAASMLAFLPSLGTGEAIVFGDGVTLPQRIRFSRLPDDALPNGGTTSFSECWSKEIEDDNFLDVIIKKWRNNADDKLSDPNAVPATTTQSSVSSPSAATVASRAGRLMDSNALAAEPQAGCSQPDGRCEAPPEDQCAPSTARETEPESRPTLRRKRIEMPADEAPLEQNLAQHYAEQPSPVDTRHVMTEQVQEQPAYLFEESPQMLAVAEEQYQTPTPQQQELAQVQAQAAAAQQELAQLQAQTAAAQQQELMQQAQAQAQTATAQPQNLVNQQQPSVVAEEQQTMHSLRKQMSSALPAAQEEGKRGSMSSLRNILRKKK